MRDHYGYQIITKKLKKKFMINHKAVQKLMRKMGIFFRVHMHKYNSSKGDVSRIAPNLLKRNLKTALRKNLCKFPYCDKNVILERLEMIAAPFFLQYTTDTVICQDTSDISRACRDT